MKIKCHKEDIDGGGDGRDDGGDGGDDGDTHDSN